MSWPPAATYCQSASAGPQSSVPCGLVSHAAWYRSCAPAHTDLAAAADPTHCWEALQGPRRSVATCGVLRQRSEVRVLVVLQRPQHLRHHLASNAHLRAPVPLASSCVARGCPFVPPYRNGSAQSEGRTVADHSAALRRTLVVGAAAMRELQESLPLWVYVSTAAITVTGSDWIGRSG